MLLWCPALQPTERHKSKGELLQNLVSNNNKKRFIEKRFLGKEKTRNQKSAYCSTCVA